MGMIWERWVAQGRAAGHSPDCNTPEGILLVNRNQGQRGGFSATIGDDDSWASPGEFLGGLRAERDAFQTIREAGEGETMADLLNLAMLICASVGSMAFSILTAYGILRVGFALMRPQPRPAVLKVRPEAARGL